MPFIRQTRDKRGFEQTFVMHVYHPGTGASQRPRVLYVFRSPANLKVGRKALDAEVMEALEHTHPDLSFDWSALSHDAGSSRVETPGDRQARRPPPRPAERPSPRRAPEPPAPPPDSSLLGRVLGAVEAARLRRRHGELAQRISRRARTPEERDRLLERARRLNPDEWPDEAVVRAQAPMADAAGDADRRGAALAPPRTPRRPATAGRRAASVWHNESSTSRNRRGWP